MYKNTKYVERVKKIIFKCHHINQTKGKFVRFENLTFPQDYYYYYYRLLKVF